MPIRVNQFKIIWPLFFSLWLRKDELNHFNGQRKWQIIPKRNPIVLNAAWHITDNQLIQKSSRNFILVFEKSKIIVKIKSVSKISHHMIARKYNFLAKSFVEKNTFRANIWRLVEFYFWSVACDLNKTVDFLPDVIIVSNQIYPSRKTTFYVFMIVLFWFL